jgi:predicted O-linked N-acetylglucosamine transferase (SPINDLY family)
MVAADPADYIDLALALGRDAGRRDAWRARIEAAAATLYDSEAPIRALESCFEQAVTASGGQSA